MGAATSCVWVFEDSVVFGGRGERRIERELIRERAKSLNRENWEKREKLRVKIERKEEIYENFYFPSPLRDAPTLVDKQTTILFQFFLLHIISILNDDILMMKIESKINSSASLWLLCYLFVCCWVFMIPIVCYKCTCYRIIA